MKLWQKETQLNADIEAFTIGQDQLLDLQLAPFDVLGSLAHTQMLQSIGLIPEDEFAKVREGLWGLYSKAINGELVIEPGIEDIHSQVELLLTQQLGEVGKKIHAARSRNDQVLLDLRLFFRSELEEIVNQSKALFDVLIQMADQYKDILLPGYTHLQVAMPSSFGLWFSAYAESLVDDVRLLQSTYQTINQNPLGSAAGYGSSFPINRQMTTELLGFQDLAYNVVHAQMGRGKSELFLGFAISALGQTIGKMAMDICLYVSQNFNFLSLPDEVTTGSSIMPHKKNPDVFELIRGRCNQLQTVPTQVSMLMANLPSGYHRDFQLLKEVVFPALQQLKDCLSICIMTIPKMQPNPNILDDPKYRYLFTVDAVQTKVLAGQSFRDAYHEVGQEIQNGTYQPEPNLNHTHEGSLGNLCLDQIGIKMEQVLAGFPFEEVHGQLAKLVEE